MNNLNLKRKIIIICLILSVLVLGVFLVIFIKNSWFNLQSQANQETTQTQAVVLNLEKVNTHLSKVSGTEGAYWMRGNDILWDNIEPRQGQFDWSITDEMARMIGEEEMYAVVIIQPYTDWDQNTCHKEDKYISTTMNKGGSQNLKVGAPCNEKAYINFLTKAVERYDGDGINDMPSLIIPIKYWEIINEPSMQGGQIGGMGEDLKFFVGTPAEYYNLLKISYQTIKKADPDSYVLHAGMAGMQNEAVDFFDPIFTKEGGQYFDIANNHTISTDERREDLSMVKFNKLLGNNGLSDKPVFITEVQFGELSSKPKDLFAFEILMAKSTALALAQGADKLFYIENWTFWDQELPKFGEEEEKISKKEKPQIDTSSSTHKVYLNLIDKLNHFDSVKTIKEEYTENPDEHSSVTSIVGQYKFSYKNKDLYVLWGQADLPPGLTGQVKVTDIYGNSSVTDASQISLSNSPIFVEKME